MFRKTKKMFNLLSSYSRMEVKGSKETVKIKVTKSPERKFKIKAKPISITEKKIIYEKEAKISKIEKYHFDNLLEMEIEDVKNKLVFSEILPILVKQILKYCNPIFLEIPENTYKFDTKEKRGVIAKQEKIKAFQKKQKKERYNISIQMPFKICGRLINTKNQLYCSPPNETVKIVGITLPSFPKNGLPKLASLYDVYTKMDKLKTGYISEISKYDELKNSETLFESEEIIFEKDPKDIKKYEGKLLNIFLNIIKFIAYVEETSEIHKNNVLELLQIGDFKRFLEKLNTRKKNKTEYVNQNTVNLDKEQNLQKKPIIKILSDLVNVNIMHKLTADINIYMTLLNDPSKLLDLYYKSLILGLNDNIKKDIADKKLENQVIRDQKDFEIKKAKNLLVITKKKAIAYNKFNTLNFDNLTERQKNIVDLEYKKLEKLLRKKSEKQCEHEKIVKDFHIAFLKSDSKGKLLKYNLRILKDTLKLKDKQDVINYEKKNQLIECASCNTEIICPHHIIRAEKHLEYYQRKGEIKSKADIRKLLIDRFAINDSLMTGLGYFCRICGEKIADIYEQEFQFYDPNTGQKITKTLNIIDELSDKIRREVIYIFNVYVRFAVEPDFRTLLKSIVSTLRPKIGDIDIKLSKIKTNVDLNKSDMLSIYITCHIYALIINMIFTNPKKMSFVEIKKKYGGKNAKGKEKLQKLFRTALEIIIKSKNSIINRLSSKTWDVEKIKNILLTAYKWVLSIKGIRIDQLEKRPDISLKLSIDALYDYIWYSKLVESGPNSNIQLYNVKKILGRSIDEIENEFAKDKTKHQLSALKMYKKAQIIVGEEKGIYDTVKIPNENKWQSKNPEKERLSSIEKEQDFEKYTYESFKATIEYILDNIYLTSAVPMSQSRTDFFEKYMPKFREFEKKKELDHQIKKLNPTFNIDLIQYWPEKYANLADNIQNISSNVFCLNNKRHKIEKYVYQKVDSRGKPSGKKYELTKKEVHEWAIKKADKFEKLQLVDQKCKICNKYIKSSKSSSSKKSKEKKDVNINTFYNYFDVRCPKGGLHEFNDSKNKDKCRKCGLVKNQKLDKSYFRKYLPKYKELQSKKKELKLRELEHLIQTIKNRKNIKKEKYPKWTISTSNILEWSKISGISYNILINLGLSENREYKLIKTGKLNPSKNTTDEEEMTKALHLYDYYMMFIRNYYLIKNHDISLDLPFKIRELIKVHSKKISLKGFKEKLPDFLENNEYEKIQYYRITQTPKELSNYILNMIAKGIIIINKTLRKTKFKQFGNEIIKYITNEMIKNENLYGKPDPFQYKSNISKDTYEKVYEEHTSDISGDEYEFRITPEPSETSDIDALPNIEQENPFSLAEVDIDKEDVEDEEYRPII